MPLHLLFSYTYVIKPLASYDTWNYCKHVDTGWKMTWMSTGIWSGGLDMLDNFQVYCILRKEVCLFSDVPRKPAHLRINTSPSTKSSLVGLNCFQGNLQSGGERISWEEGKARQNAENKMECFNASSSCLNSMDLMLVRLTVPHASVQNRMCWQLLVGLPLNWVYFPPVDEC